MFYSLLFMNFNKAITSQTITYAAFIKAAHLQQLWKFTVLYQQLQYHEKMLLTVCCASDWNLYLCLSASELAPENSLEIKQNKPILTKIDSKFQQYMLFVTDKSQWHHNSLDTKFLSTISSVFYGTWVSDNHSTLLWNYDLIVG